MRHFFIIARVDGINHEFIVTAGHFPRGSEIGLGILAHEELRQSKIIITCITEINPKDCRELKFSGVRNMTLTK